MNLKPLYKNKEKVIVNILHINNDRYDVSPIEGIVKKSMLKGKSFNYIVSTKFGVFKDINERNLEKNK